MDGSLIPAGTVADSLNMALYFPVLQGIAEGSFFRSVYSRPHIDAAQAAGPGEGDETSAAGYRARRGVSLRDIVPDMACAAAAVLLSRTVGGSFWAGSRRRAAPEVR